MKYEENQFFKLLRMKYIKNIYSLSNNGISYILYVILYYLYL